MNREELQEAIFQTMKDITQIKRKLDGAAGVKERRRLRIRKKELQYLQIWCLNQLDQLENLK